MTTRRGRSSGSGQPGTQAWRRRIGEIKRELEARNGRLIRVLEEQDAEYVEEVQPLLDLAQSLRVEDLLSYMNDTLLDGQGIMQTVLVWDEQQVLEDDDDWDEDDDDNDEEDDEDEDWEEDDDEDDDDDGDEDEDSELFVVLRVMLSWKAGGRLQLRVEFEDEDGEIEMQVNGYPVDPPNASNLQSGLIKAFREQMDENYGKFEDEE